MFYPGMRTSENERSSGPNAKYNIEISRQIGLVLMKSSIERISSRCVPHQCGTIADNYEKERHRIDVDCRRTDRTQPLFIAPSPGPSTPGGTPGPSQATHRSKFSPANDEIGAQSQANEHVEKLCEILLTYELYEKKLGKHHFCSWKLV